MLRPLEGTLRGERVPNLFIGLQVSDAAFVYKARDAADVIQAVDFSSPHSVAEL